MPISQQFGGKVNDVFYYYREQAAFKAKQFQRALDDIAKAIELNPKELTYRAEQAVINLRVGRNEGSCECAERSSQDRPQICRSLSFTGHLSDTIKEEYRGLRQLCQSKRTGRYECG